MLNKIKILFPHHPEIIDLFSKLNNSAKFKIMIGYIK